MAKNRRSWLDGPEISSQFGDGQPSYPGEAMGLPERGAGALGSVRRRIGGVLIDWLICWALVWAFTALTTAISAENLLEVQSQVATNTYLLWLILGIVCGWLFARTPGQAALGMGIARVDAPGHKVGLWRAAVRTILTGFILPAAMVDADGRGIHDRATGTTVIMTR